jgi:hypothetical protein
MCVAAVLGLDRTVHWSRGLRSVSAAFRLLGLRVRIPPSHGILSVVSVTYRQVERSLCRADHSSRGVLLSVVCLSVIMKSW